MSRRKESHRRGLLSPKAVAAVILLVAIVAIAYAVSQPALRILNHRERADIALLNAAVDSACAAIEPREASVSTFDLGGHEVRYDLLELSRDTSVFRANREITGAVEKAGGRIAYGLDSSDGKRRWQTVTLGISDGDSLIREVRLKKRIR
jgi:hypothetical protein